MNHVKITNDDTHSWCGISLGVDFHFKDAEQAALNGLHGHKTVCPDCIDRIYECLNRNNFTSKY